MDYYNDFDPGAAAWLRELVTAGCIPAGVVDDRSITEVTAADLAGYERCHFFAGIGGWPLALDLAGWDGPVWTASLPCQPFSAAGKQQGERDERHLWPTFFSLVRECRPDCLLGEQVASADGYRWLDGVRTDLESEGYAFGAADMAAAGVGAPHIRQRLFWVAHMQEQRRGQGHSQRGWRAGGVRKKRHGSGPADVRGDGGLAHAGHGKRRRPDDERPAGDGAAERVEEATQPRRRGPARGLGDADGAGSQGHGRPVSVDDESRREDPQRHHSASSFWDRFDLIPCADGKTRRTQPGVHPLAHGLPAHLDEVWTACVPDAPPPKETFPGRIGLLRGFGNAIVPEVAARFIKAVQEALNR